ncbi:MAG: mechanosensitive ion channel family protein [Anaerolineales bacterium]|nr:mechanosensitive ion channel family protein [Anaerolineales bacterium]
MQFLSLSVEQWGQIGISALIVLVTVFLGRWLIRFLLQRVFRAFVKRTETTLDDAIIQALLPSMYMLAIVIALDVGVDRLDFIPGAWQARLGDVFYVSYFLIVFIALWRIIVFVTKWYGLEIASKTETKLDEKMIPLFIRVAQIALVLIALVMLLGHFDVDASGLVATLGVGSLAVALAAKETLEDTLAGFVIMIDRPFRIGDRIEIQDLDTWGDVVDIGLRSSRIRTRDNRMVIVPNSIIGKSLIVNYSYPDTQYRIQIHIGVEYGTEIEFARETIISAVEGVEGVLPDKSVEALFLEFGDSALIFRVRWWLESYVDTRRMFDQVNSAIYRALNDQGIGIPNPQLDVHHRFDSQQAPLLTRQLEAKG